MAALALLLSILALVVAGLALAYSIISIRREP